MKLNKKYVAPKATLTRVACESAICAASGEPVNTGNNNDVTIDQQTDGGEFNFSNWD